MKIAGFIMAVIVLFGTVPIIVVGPGGPIKEIQMTQSWVIKLPTAISAWWVVLLLVFVVVPSLRSIFLEWRKTQSFDEKSKFWEKLGETFGSSAALGATTSVLAGIMLICAFGLLGRGYPEIGILILASATIGLLFGFFLFREPEGGLGVLVGITMIGILLSLTSNFGCSSIIRLSFLIGGCACFGSSAGMFLHRVRKSLRARFARP